MFTFYFTSPVGVLKITSDEKSILNLSFAKKSGINSANQPKCLKDCARQLEEYFAGKRRDFDLPLDLVGTAFQKNVWRGLQRIGYGETESYSGLARKIKNPKAFRAVGMANNKNKIAIIIPCHRVIGSDGSLTGYAGGLQRKEWLLKHEKSFETY